jgi:hypothetical protein
MKKSNFSFSRVAGAALCAAAMIFIGCAQAFDASKSKVFGSITLDLSIEGVPKVVQNSTGPLFTVYPAAENFSNFTLSFTVLSDGADQLKNKLELDSKIREETLDDCE